jgi:hypothetical protein
MARRFERLPFGRPARHVLAVTEHENERPATARIGEGQGRAARVDARRRASGEPLERGRGVRGRVIRTR